jgi:hypothetical protein
MHNCLGGLGSLGGGDVAVKRMSKRSGRDARCCVVFSERCDEKKRVTGATMVKQQACGAASGGE